MGNFLNKLKNEKKIMIEKIGSPRKTRLLDSYNSQSSLEYEDIEEYSSESIKMREARN